MSNISSKTLGIMYDLSNAIGINTSRYRGPANGSMSRPVSSAEESIPEMAPYLNSSGGLLIMLSHIEPSSICTGECAKAVKPIKPSVSVSKDGKGASKCRCSSIIR
jgi:hypothetical protein